MSDHDDALIEKAADALDEWLFRMHGLTSSCRHHDEARAVLDAVADGLRAEVLNEAADVMSERLDQFPAEGRHTRARWAEQWLRDRAARMTREEADRG